MLIPNLNVSIKGTTIIANQKNSTPGIYKIFNVIPNTNYVINFKEFESLDTNLILWIATMDNYCIKITNIDDRDYYNKMYNQIKVGILFKSHKIGDHFKIRDIMMEKVIKPENKIIKNVNENINKISVIIPCHYNHFKYVDKLLRYYDNQTLLPLEVIIVVSETENKNTNTKWVENHKYYVRIIKIKGKSAAGNNRYIGAKNAKGSLLVFQDADDFPHHQRLEIINYFFDKYQDIVHICHKFDYNENKMKYNNLDNIDHEIITTNDVFMLPKIRIPEKITNGNVAIRKEIYDKVNWFNDMYRGQDVQFNNGVYNKYKRTLYIKVPIYYYRKLLSVKNFIKVI